MVTTPKAIEAAPQDPDDLVRFAPGWQFCDPGHVSPEQREQQLIRCLDLLWLHAVSGSEDVPIGEAVTVLRAGPGATPLELEHGRTA